MDKQEILLIHGEVDEDLECPICFAVMDTPYMLVQCQHEFCLSCIDKVEECPLCRQPAHHRRPALKTSARIARLEVFCYNKARGCDWTGTFESLSVHAQQCLRTARLPTASLEACDVHPVDKLPANAAAAAAVDQFAAKGSQKSYLPVSEAAAEHRKWYDEEVRKDPPGLPPPLPSLTPGQPNPIEQSQQMILEAVSAHRVVILTAHTGSGKSTTVPWLMLQRRAGRVLCTQPRRIAAVALAHRVASLCCTEVGQEIGYWIGGQQEFDPAKTRLIYMTNSVAMMLLLQEGATCTHLIIDEIHTRTLFDDVLLAIVKTHLLEKNPDLRVILMSAATDSAALAQYFQRGAQLHVPVLEVGHSTHTVREVYLEDIPILQDRGEDLTMADVGDLVWELHGTHPAAAVFLVFLPGRGDIAELTDHLEELMEEHPLEKPLDIQALHSSIAMETQQELLASVTGGARRVLLATDIVESSVTIPDVDVVVDLCIHKRRRWNDSLKDHQLRGEFISKDEATQRKGRTGRLRNGVVYRLVTHWKFAQLPAHAPSQMGNSNIAEVLLALFANKACVDPVELLRQCPEPPSKRQVDDGFRLLRETGALKHTPGEKTAGFQLTPFGHLLQRLPLDVQAAALVMNGVRFNCLSPMLTIAGVVLRGMPFLDDQCVDAAAALRLWGVKHACCPDSDLLCALRAYEVWQGQLAREGAAWSVREEAQWCRDRCLSLSVLREIEEQTIHIQDALAKVGLAREVPKENRRLLSGRRRAAQKLGNVPLSRSGAPSTAALPDMMASLVRQTPSAPRRTELLIRWCIAAAFPHNTLELTGAVGPTVMYTCRQRKYHQLQTFLSQRLNLRVIRAGEARGTRRRVDIPVSFSGPEEAQRALQLAAAGRNGAFPYSRARAGHEVGIAARKCHVGPFIHASESVCFPPLSVKTMVVSAKMLPVQAKSDYYVCSFSTVVPFGILGAVVIAAYPVRRYGLGGRLLATFHGVEEEVPFAPSPQVAQLVAELRQHLEKEEETGVAFRHSLVAEERATLAVRLMEALYALPPPAAPAGQQTELKLCPTCNVRFCRGRECKDCWQKRNAARTRLDRIPDFLNDWQF